MNIRGWNRAEVTITPPAVGVGAQRPTVLAEFANKLVAARGRHVVAEHGSEELVDGARLRVDRVADPVFALTHKATAHHLQDRLSDGWRRAREVDQASKKMRVELDHPR